MLAIEAVASWKSWTFLFRRLEDTDFLVPINKDGVPQKTSDFEKDFIKVISKITDAVLRSFEKLLNDSFDDFSKKYQEKWNDCQITHLKQTFALVRDKLEKFPERVGCWLENPLISEMTKLYDIGSLKKELSQRFPLNVSLETFDESGYSRYYRLQHGDKPLFFAWTEEVQSVAQEAGVVTRDQRHLMGVVQIRQAFFDAVTLFIDDLYSDVRYQLVKYLDSANFDDFFQDVSDILNEQIVDEPALDWTL